jgi:hypothetical protein
LPDRQGVQPRFNPRWGKVFLDSIRPAQFPASYFEKLARISFQQEARPDADHGRASLSLGADSDGQCLRPSTGTDSTRDSARLFLLSAFLHWAGIAPSLRAADPKVPVLYTSGNCNDRERQVSNSLFFDKPYRPAAILSAIEGSLVA